MKQSRLEQFKDKILELKQRGYGSRYIANLLGFGKSTINDFLKKNNTPVNKEIKKPRILFLDCETSPTMAAVWRLWKENVSLDQITNDWFIMSHPIYYSLPLTETLAEMPGGHQSLVLSLYILLKKLKASAMSDILLGS